MIYFSLHWIVNIKQVISPKVYIVIIYKRILLLEQAVNEEESCNVLCVYTYTDACTMKSTFEDRCNLNLD